MMKQIMEPIPVLDNARHARIIQDFADVCRIAKGSGAVSARFDGESQRAPLASELRYVRGNTDLGDIDLAYDWKPKIENREEFNGRRPPILRGIIYLTPLPEIDMPSFHIPIYMCCPTTRLHRS
jgi:hypothetical protein